MGIVLLCLILGLAFAIERIIYLNLATTNTKKLAEALKKLYVVELMLQKKFVEIQKDLLLQFIYQGLDRANEGVRSC